MTTLSWFRHKKYWLTLIAASVFILSLVGLRPTVVGVARRYNVDDELNRMKASVERVIQQPNVAWDSAQPESVGLDSSKLDRLSDYLVNMNTDALLIVKNNKIVYEYFPPGGTENSKYGLSAVGKSAAASMVIAVALDDGLISLDDPAWKYIPAWKDDPVKSKITIRHLVTHSSGIENVIWGAGLELEGWKSEFEHNHAGRFALAINEAPVLFEPGTDVEYSSVGYYALSYALTASLADSDYGDIHALLEHRIMNPLDIPPDAWSISYGESYQIDGLNLYYGAGAEYTARAAARIGQLMLDRGQWNGQQLIAPEIVDAMVSYGESPQNSTLNSTFPDSGLGWLLNRDDIFPSLPPDAFLAAGADHKVILVIPSMDMVVVRLGSSLVGDGNFDEAFWSELDKYLFAPLMEAVEPGE